jgi:hypothetical protein
MLGYHSFTRFGLFVWLTVSSRVDAAMRGSSISFFTRARSAWLDSCLGCFLYILARCHKPESITGQFGTALTVLENGDGYPTARHNRRKTTLQSLEKRSQITHLLSRDAATSDMCTLDQI